MRTTVTLDEDVARRLKERMRQTGQSFKQALNEVLRKGLEGPVRRTGEEVRVHARPMGLRPGIDPARLHDLETDLEADRFRETTRRLIEKKRRR